MSSKKTEYYNCPKCGTYFKATITTGVQPYKTEEPVNCPVCWEEVAHKNITGDVDCQVESLAQTREPYKANYIQRQIEEKVTQIIALHHDGILGSVIKNVVIYQVNNATIEDIQKVLSKMVKDRKIIIIPRAVVDGDTLYALPKQS